ncbi:hypothetical protein A3860_18660 [Niastella vici]|uniref:Uncharacterized protein n=1 Tax=Niastella vici TaxID=1703345 RepID=A0A1V9G2H9_9BACT|nr:hypothetical protein A3860_18660 [Niastella vici]
MEYKKPLKRCLIKSIIQNKVCYLSNNCAVLANNCADSALFRESVGGKRKCEFIFKPFLVQPFLSLHCQFCDFIDFKISVLTFNY